MFIFDIIIINKFRFFKLKRDHVFYRSQIWSLNFSTFRGKTLVLSEVRRETSITHSKIHIKNDHRSRIIDFDYLLCRSERDKQTTTQRARIVIIRACTFVGCRALPIITSMLYENVKIK